MQSGNNSRRTVMNSEWIKRGGTLSTSIRREREKRGSGGQDKEKYKSAFLCFRPPGYCFPPNPCFTVKTALREDTWRSAGAAFQKDKDEKDNVEEEWRWGGGWWRICQTEDLATNLQAPDIHPPYLLIHVVLRDTCWWMVSWLAVMSFPVISVTDACFDETKQYFESVLHLCENRVVRWPKQCASCHLL